MYSKSNNRFVSIMLDGSNYTRLSNLMGLVNLLVFGGEEAVFFGLYAAESNLDAENTA